MTVHPITSLTQTRAHSIVYVDSKGFRVRTLISVYDSRCSCRVDDLSRNAATHELDVCTNVSYRYSRGLSFIGGYGRWFVTSILITLMFGISILVNIGVSEPDKRLRRASDSFIKTGQKAAE